VASPYVNLITDTRPVIMLSKHSSKRTAQQLDNVRRCEFWRSQRNTFA
jgi:hypothetical protein